MPSKQTVRLCSGGEEKISKAQSSGGEEGRSKDQVKPPGKKSDGLS